MKYHIIYNPAAKSGKSKASLDTVVRCLEKEGREYVLHETVAKGHAEILAREITQTDEELIVIGGDGTVHEVLNGIVNPQQVRLAIIPAGTGNDFCVGARIPEDVESVMGLVLSGQTKPTDYIEFSNRRCMNVGGLGMDVDVLQRVEKGKMHGKLKYLWSLLSSAFTFKGYQIRLSSQGKVYHENALFAAVCNGSQFGGGIRICPTAQVDDNKLEVVFVKQLGLLGIIRALFTLLRGKILNFPATTHFACDEVEIFPDVERTIQMDGELYDGYRALKAKIQHGLKIYR